MHIMATWYCVLCNPLKQANGFEKITLDYRFLLPVAQIQNILGNKSQGLEGKTCTLWRRNGEVLLLDGRRGEGGDGGGDGGRREEDETVRREANENGNR